ncbi:MAG: hypothetical protein IJ567_03420 [Lachnospiraceae bacterium]|nr:hypothetical protein [Lachnospiraceae bacterium]
MADKQTFDYTYSARKNEEIIKIKKKYNIDQPELSDQDLILKKLREIDRSTTRPGTIAGLTIGIIGTLIMGTGMSMAMVWNDRFFALGIVIGILGIAVVIAAYPVYSAITEKKRAENAPKIREITDQLPED